MKRHLKVPPRGKLLNCKTQHNTHTLKSFIATTAILLLLVGCSAARQGSTPPPQKSNALSVLLKNPALQPAHIGISIYDIARDSFIVNYQHNKFFVPASNIKIATCYAAMRWLGDSSLSFRVAENDTAIFVEPAGDPSFLHRDFLQQPALEWLKTQTKPLYFSDQHWQSQQWGSGWAWSDYDAAYMAERSALPIYGNTIRWEQVWAMNPYDDELAATVTSDPPTDWPVNFSINNPDSSFRVERAFAENYFTIYEGKEDNPRVELPFVTHGIRSALQILEGVLEKPVHYYDRKLPGSLVWKPLYSQPLDSILKTMMTHSDNFLAEQLLLGVSYKLTGILNEQVAIDSMLKTTLSDLPDLPRWADGSGLSRYNLFTPRDFVMILKKMRAEVGMERIKTVFSAGGRGTLANYFMAKEPYLYAKTGTLSGVVTLSGFIDDEKGNPYIFSILVNNHRATATEVRRAVELYLKTTLRRGL